MWDVITKQANLHIVPCIGEYSAWIKSIPEKDTDNNSWWYLHGRLEEMIGFDKAVVINCSDEEVSSPTIAFSRIDGDQVTSVRHEEPWYRMCYNGVTDVKVEGVEESCIGFFWTDNHHDVFYKGETYPMWDQRGYVCLKSDEEACKWAAEQQKQGEFNMILSAIHELQSLRPRLTAEDIEDISDNYQMYLEIGWEIRDLKDRLAELE